MYAAGLSDNAAGCQCQLCGENLPALAETPAKLFGVSSIQDCAFVEATCPNCEHKMTVDGAAFFILRKAA